MSKPKFTIVPPHKRPTLEELPKVELHRHLEGAVRPSTIRDFAAQAGVSVPIDPEAFLDAFLIRSQAPSLKVVIDLFLRIQKFYGLPGALERIAFEAVEDAHREGIRILELRYAPTVVTGGHPGLTWDSAHDQILQGLARAKLAYPSVAVGLICILQRTLPLAEAESVMRFAIDNKSTFVGVDLADDESFNAAPFARAFEKARAAGLMVTIHAGESNVPLAARSVIEAIELLGASRIGHGLQIWRSEQALEIVKAKKIPLELCPTSNWITSAVPSLESHPFRALREEGVLTTICSDDPGMFGIDLNNEYRVLKELFDFDYEDFQQMNDVAAAASFLPFAEKQAVWPRPIDRSLAPRSK